jgi:hypothetical protein
MDDELVTIASFKTGSEAELLRGHLLAEGIASVMLGETLSTLEPGTGGAWTPVRVQVRNDDAPAAARLVAELDALRAARRANRAAETCLACGTPLAPEARRCAACGWTWETAAAP